MTAIQPNQQCLDEYGTPVGSDQQLLRFDVEIWAAQQFNQDASSALFLQNWAVGDAQGVDTDLRDHTAIRCGGALTGDQISKSVVPGAHVKESIYITAQKDATVLRLYLHPNGDGWVWNIPTA